MMDTRAIASAPTLGRRIRRVLGRIYRDLGPIEDACRAVLRKLAFRVRIVLVWLGLLNKEVLVMNCREESELDGFYSHFTAVLGLLEQFERWRVAIAGVRVDFEDRGLYYDPARGSNSWEYHVQPVEIRCDAKAVERRIGSRERDRRTREGERMPRKRAADLVARYIHVKPHIREKVDAFAFAHFSDFHVIGVHYRGTDKWLEAPRVPYGDVCTAVRAAIRAAPTERCRLFVASDEQAFVECMEGAFPGKVVSWETRRSRDGEPIDFIMDNNFKKGEDVLVDCLLLSRCDHLIRTSSSLSLCSTYFNPALPVVLLNQEYRSQASAPGE